MFKQLVLIALVIAGLWWLRRMRRRLAGRRQRRSGVNGAYEETVRCAHCGTHVLRSQAIGGPRDEHFCNEAHRLARQGGELKKRMQR